MSLDMENVDAPNDSLIMQYTRQVIKRSELIKHYVNQPKIVRKRISALRKLQLRTTDLDVEFHQKVCDLERQFESRHREIFEKRNEIINGSYEPKDEECDFPDPHLDLEQQIISMNMNSNNSNERVKGIPDFWLTIFKYFPLLEPLVKDSDEAVLKHLTDVRVISKTEPFLSFLLEFYFSPNEYFTNSKLTKEYFLKCAADPEEPLAFDGPEIFKCVGCKIDWCEGKNLTSRTIKKKATAGSRQLPVQSFFNFFGPPEIPDDENDPNFDAINDSLEKDFEIGHYLKERVIPRAVLYFTGESEEFSPEGSSSENSESANTSLSRNDEEEDNIDFEAEGDA